MAEHADDLPASPGIGKPEGWYRVGGVNDQAHWDGEHWTGRRRWSGASWTEVPLYGVGALGATSGPPSSLSRKWFVIGLVALVAAIGLGAGLVYATSSSTTRSRSTSPQVARNSSPQSTSPVTVPHQSESAVASCEADAKSLVVALEAYMAQNGSFPTPPSTWNAATYASNYAPLTGSAHGGPWLHEPPSTTNYVIEYDSSGNVWVAPPGSYGAIFNPGQGFDQHPDICFAAAA